MSIVNSISESREDRAPYVRFERAAVEDKARSLAEGRYVAKDVDYALITPSYSRDVIRMKVSSWLDSVSLDLKNGRIPKEWADFWQQSYQKWKAGEEMPLRGTAIKGWGVISPAQQENLIRMNILTVEDLAGINDEGIRRIGMGAQELKTKANAWLKTLDERGPLTMQNAALQTENDNLKAQVAKLESDVGKLSAELNMFRQLQARPAAIAVESQSPSISADDILATEEQPKQKKPK